jgi:hypothetical protein
MIGLEGIHMFHEGHDFLLTVEDASIPNRHGKVIGLEKKSFAAFQVFQSKTLHILGKQAELAKAIVRMAMEGADERLVLEVTHQSPERTAIECDSKLTPCVVPTPLVGS